MEPQDTQLPDEMPCHHKLEAYLDAYIEVAGVGAERKRPLFRAAVGKTGKLSEKPMGLTDVWYMILRRAADAGIETKIGCTFRLTGITDYLRNGGKLEIAQRMAGHSNAKTTVSMIGATMRSASAKSSGWGFKVWVRAQPANFELLVLNLE